MSALPDVQDRYKLCVSWAILIGRQERKGVERYVAEELEPEAGEQWHNINSRQGELHRSGYAGRDTLKEDDMPEVVVAWYDREDEEAGYHICENCRIGRNIDMRHIEITSEEYASALYELCLSANFA